MVRLFGGSLGGRKRDFKFRIRTQVTGELFIPAFELAPDNARKYLDEVKNMGETFIQGYCSSIYDLALYARKINYTGLKIKGVFTTAEQLAPEQADIMREVFNAPVKSFFGCAEINSLGFQATEGGPYLIPDEVNFIENYSDPVTRYNLLLTSLYNYKMPMIRYLNGDTGLVKRAHENGTNRSCIMDLQGRTADMFVRPDGSYISSIVATQTMQISGLLDKIRKYQLIQTGPTQVVINYAPFFDSLTGEEEQHIVNIYRKRLGTDFDITINRNENFIVSAAGKHRLMIRQYEAGSNKSPNQPIVNKQS
jgi:phenylacetate-CoA ligase